MSLITIYLSKININELSRNNSFKQIKNKLILKEHKYPNHCRINYLGYNFNHKLVEGWPELLTRRCKLCLH